MFVHCKQCEVKAHLSNGRYVIEITIPARKRKAIKEYINGPVLRWVTVNEPERKVKALSVRNFRFARFYTLHKMETYDNIGCLKTQWFIGPCVSRL